MNGNQMIEWLRGIEKNTLGLACSGCGFEHNCSQKGCAAAKKVRAFVKAAVGMAGICDMCRWSVEGDMGCLDTMHKLECSECKDKCVCGKCENGENFELDEELI